MWLYDLLLNDEHVEDLAYVSSVIKQAMKLAWEQY